jgi:threonine dehydratase
MATSLDAGRVVEIPNLPTLADGLAGQIDEAGLEIGRAALDGMAVVSEGDIARAIVWLAETEDLVVEGSGAVGIAALMTGALGSLEGPVAVVVSGGNIDRERHERILRGVRLAAPATARPAATADDETPRGMDAGARRRARQRDGEKKTGRPPRGFAAVSRNRRGDR